MLADLAPYFPFLTVLGTLVTFGVTILRGQKDNRDKFEKWLDLHEAKDEERYLEILRRFEKVAVSLAKSGIPNGTADH